MSDPLVSIILPVFNGERHVGEALESALAQDYPRFEVVVVDDGSTDRTGEVVDGFARRRPDRVRVLRQENQGVAGALNAGLRAMAGHYFCWLSHDDLYTPDKLSAQVAFMRDRHWPEALLFGGWDCIDDQGRPLASVPLDPSDAYRSALEVVLSGAINGCTVMAPRRLLEDAGGFDPRYRYVQDYRLWARLARTTPFLKQPGRLVLQRLHPGQDSARHAAAADREAEAFWSELVLGTTPSERAAIAGGDPPFYRRFADQLQRMNLANAAEQVRRVGLDSAERASVSVVLLTARTEQAAAAATLASLAEDLAGGAQMVVCAGSDEASLRAALLATTGDYVVFLRTGRQVLSGEATRTAWRMAREGRTAGALRRRPGSSDDPSLPAVMLHRYLLDEGVLCGIGPDGLDTALERTLSRASRGQGAA